MLDDEQLVRPLQEVVDRRAHRALGDVDEDFRVEVLLRPDEERLPAALVVRRDRDELEDPLDVVSLEACLEEALGRSVAHEALRARAGVDPRRLDTDRASGTRLGRRGDPAQRDHLLRREPRDRRASVDRPLGADPDLGAERALPLDDAARDVLGEHLDEQRLAIDDELDGLLEELGEARHVHALLIGSEIDGAVDHRGHDRLRRHPDGCEPLSARPRHLRARARARSRVTRPGGLPRASRRSARGHRSTVLRL